MSITSLSFSLPNNPNRFSSTKATMRVGQLFTSMEEREIEVRCECYKSYSRISVLEKVGVLEDGSVPRLDDGGSGNNSGSFPLKNDGNGIGSGGGDKGDEYEDREFEPIMKLEDVMRETEKFGATLPSDLVEATKTTGIKKLLLMQYLEFLAIRVSDEASVNASEQDVG
ncbi:hypothetical protein Cgig2_017603 [Carnegiea gigantea]|uniref:Uncharacterized protein n=1 Tax=Carnegiea gigantea TaxID=171969 RepID=A0A9Q1QLM0_9CARY|nr:hypothetical protein Cgig2_017603 [Carnegiea gigantea]